MNGNYENYLIREMTECAPGDTTCSDCNQIICACESLADWHRERDQETEPYTHEEAEQRREWLREAYLDQGHLHT